MAPETRIGFSATPCEHVHAHTKGLRELDEELG